jgi:exfoliative toxin A/B
MKAFIRSIPLPLSGVMLGTAALGNLIQSYSETLRTVCGAVAGLLLLLLVLKLILFPKSVAEDLKNPVLASVLGTFPMGLMLLTVYWKPVIGAAAKILWLAAILLHAALIIYFTARFIKKDSVPKLLASYFVVYVGMAVASVTSPAYEMTGLGMAIYWLSFALLLIALPFVSYRYIKYRTVPQPAQPLICIFTAPASLCLAGYLQSAANKSLPLVYFMMALACVLYIVALINLPRLLKLPFYPSFAAFTFPFVISAIAMKQSNGFLMKAGAGIPWLQYVVLFETVVAAALVVYALVRYFMAIISAAKAPIASQS